MFGYPPLYLICVPILSWYYVRLMAFELLSTLAFVDICGCPLKMF